MGYLGAAVIPPINAWMIAEWGWPFTWKFWGVLLILFFVPLAFIFIRNRPEDVGLTPDRNMKNERISEIDHTQQQPPEVEEDSWTLKESMKTRPFWFILFCASVFSMLVTGMTFHLISILGESGLSPTAAAFILSIFAIVGFPVTFMSGFILEKMKVHLLIAVCLAGELVTLLLLLVVNSMGLAILFGVIRGAITGFEKVCFNIIWPNYFGRKHLGSINGVVMMTLVISSAFGPLPFGFAFDWFGGYKEILLFMMIFPVLGIFAALASTPPKKI